MSLQPFISMYGYMHVPMHGYMHGYMLAMRTGTVIDSMINHLCEYFILCHNYDCVMTCPSIDMVILQAVL